jgi:hypothetical protein
VTSPLHLTVAELADMVQAPSPDPERFFALGQRLLDGGRELTPDELTLAIGELTEVLKHDPYGEFARLAAVARSFVRWGGSPLPLVPEVVPHIVRTVALRALLSQAWPTLRRWRWPASPPAPHADTGPSWDALVTRCKANADRFGLTEAGAVAMARSRRDVAP